MYSIKSLINRISLIFVLPAFSVGLMAQVEIPADTSYFVPWDDNYNLLIAADRADSLSIKLLLGRGADINATTVEGVTPLMYATEKGNLDIIRLLVERKADINKKPYNGITALMVAAKNNYYDVAEYLVSQKAQLNIRDSEGITAVHYAAALNNYDVMDMLIFYGADKELADSKGNTPLISAAYTNSLEAADLLIQNGANIDTADNNGFTALMTAIQKGNMDVAYLLIDKGADIHAINAGGYSALTFAVISKDAELTETLINMGANVNQKTTSGYTVLEIAKKMEEDEIVELLQANDAKSGMNPHLNTLSVGPYLDFNFTDYMNGLQVSLLDSRYGIGINGGFGFRPLANRVLYKYSDIITYQYWERRYYFYAGLDKKFDFIKNMNVATGPYLGLNEVFTFGGYRGSEANLPLKFITSPCAGWYYSNTTFKTWAGYQLLDYKTPGIKGGRIVLGISVNIGLTKKGYTSKKILWLE